MVVLFAGYLTNFCTVPQNYSEEDYFSRTKWSFVLLLLKISVWYHMEILGRAGKNDSSSLLWIARLPGGSPDGVDTASLRMMNYILCRF